MVPPSSTVALTASYFFTLYKVYIILIYVSRDTYWRYRCMPSLLVMVSWAKHNRWKSFLFKNIPPLSHNKAASQSSTFTSSSHHSIMCIPNKQTWVYISPVTHKQPHFSPGHFSISLAFSIPFLFDKCFWQGFTLVLLHQLGNSLTLGLKNFAYNLKSPPQNK